VLLVAYWGLVKFSNTKIGAKVGAKLYTKMMDEFDEFKKLAEKYNKEMRK